MQVQHDLMILADGLNRRNVDWQYHELFCDILIVTALISVYSCSAYSPLK